jgi:hypothetical protein
VERTDKEQAEEASAMINEITQDQYSLLVGYQETAYSYETIKYMYDQLETRRRNYLQLFTGITRKEKLDARYFVVPIPETLGAPYPVAGFNSTTGLTEPGGGNDVDLKIEGDGMAEILGEASTSAMGFSGYYYRIPETCEVSLNYQGESLVKETIVINQAGVVRNLPPDITYVRFDPRTGGITKVVLK